MGTPGDKSRIKKLVSDNIIQLDQESNDLPESISQPQTHQTEDTTSKMTILSCLPNFDTFIGFNINSSLPECDNIDLNISPTIKLQPINFFADKALEIPTFHQLDEPGPSGLQSGLQTPKSSKPTTKISVKRNKKSPQSQKKQYNCHVCQKAFQNTSKLSKHQQIHGNSSPFKCDHCKKTFSSRFKLVRHVLIHSDRKPFSCSVCDRTFHRKDHLKNHIKVHSPCKQLYTCEKLDCKKEYTSLLSYKKHLALHAAEEGSLECQICLKTFKTKDEILYHLKIHAGSRTVKNPDEKKFSCDHCERKFFTRKDVRRHLVVHTGMRDFLCQYCPQRFGRKDHLVRHIKKSHFKLQTDETITKAIKTETEESNLSNPEMFTPNLDFDTLFQENFEEIPEIPLLDTPSDVFLPHTSTQTELTDLGSEILNEIAVTTEDILTSDILEENDLIGQATFINLLNSQTDENFPLPAFSKTFQSPPQPPPQ